MNRYPRRTPEVGVQGAPPYAEALEIRRAGHERFWAATPTVISVVEITVKGTRLDARHLGSADVDCLELFGVSGLICRMYCTPSPKEGRLHSWRARRLFSDPATHVYAEATLDERTVSDFLWEAFPDFTVLGSNAVIGQIDEQELRDIEAETRIAS